MTERRPAHESGDDEMKIPVVPRGPAPGATERKSPIGRLVVDLLDRALTAEAEAGRQRARVDVAEREMHMAVERANSATVKLDSVAEDRAEARAEVAALRAEREKLAEQVVKIDAEREFVEHSVVEFTESKHKRQRDEARDEFAAECARHETTRRGLRAVVGALSNTDGDFLPAESFDGLVGVIFQAITESGLDPNDFIALAASPPSTDLGDDPDGDLDGYDGYIGPPLPPGQSGPGVAASPSPVDTLPAGPHGQPGDQWWCGDPGSGIGCVTSGCTHDDPARFLPSPVAKRGRLDDPCMSCGQSRDDAAPGQCKHPTNHPPPGDRGQPREASDD